MFNKSLHRAGEPVGEVSPALRIRQQAAGTDNLTVKSRRNVADFRKQAEALDKADVALKSLENDI